MRWGLVLVIVAACAAKAPDVAAPVASPASPTPPIESTSDGGRVSAKRPHVAVVDFVPDFQEELRWPLPAMSHPELEPQFPIARELAIDVGWEDLCARGVHRRVIAAKAEQLEYLRAWCSVLERDIAAACQSLKSLMLSNLRGMREAVRRDLANILVGYSDAEAAEGHITRNAIRDTRVLDLLAASYAEMGKRKDAYAINRLAIDADTTATPATKCRRLAKHIVLMPDASERELHIENLRSYVVDRSKADPTCLELADAVACWSKPGDDCMFHFARNNIHMGFMLVAGVYFAWPDSADWYQWWHVGDQLYHALHLPGAVDLALTAYEASIVAHSACETDRAAAVQRAIVAIRSVVSDTTYDGRLQELARACPWQAPSASAPPAASPDP